MSPDRVQGTCTRVPVYPPRLCNWPWSMSLLSPSRRRLHPHHLPLSAVGSAGKEYSFEADFWSLGITMISLFTGQHPHPLYVQPRVVAVHVPVGHARCPFITCHPLPFPALLSFSLLRRTKGMWALMKAILELDQPVLDPAVFPPDACDFVHQCLNAPREDATYADKLLEHPFIAAAKVRACVRACV